MSLTALTFVAMLLWAVILLLPWRPWDTRERLEAQAGAADGAADLSDVVALIPARNEAERIADTLTSLRAQGRELRIVVVDDESEDNTATVVEAFDGAGVTLVRGRPLPQGWTGKVWAQAQGEPLLARPLVLLLDADIRLSPGMLVALSEKLREENSDLVSVMAELPMKNTWERLLIPAFVFFFKLLYPFRLVNAAKSPIAAAAIGGSKSTIKAAVAARTVFTPRLLKPFIQNSWACSLRRPLLSSPGGIRPTMPARAFPCKVSNRRGPSHGQEKHARNWQRQAQTRTETIKF